MSKFMKNTANVDRILTWLDAGGKHAVYFAMNETVSLTDEPGCGTAACIAGAAYQFSIGAFGQPTPVVNWGTMLDGAMDFLGMDDSDLAQKLFLAELPVYEVNQITAEQAAACLRSVRDHGFVVWPKYIMDLLEEV